MIQGILLLAFGAAVSAQASSAPTTTTQAAGLITSTSSIINALVNPNGLAAEAWFEYGASSGSYALSTPKQALAAGTADMAVSAQLANLAVGQTYYYRAAAQNSAGAAYGGERSFQSTIDLKSLAPGIEKKLTLGFSLGFLNSASTDSATALSVIQGDGFTHLRTFEPFVKSNNGKDDTETFSNVISDIKRLDDKGFNIMLSLSNYPYEFAPAFAVDPDTSDNVNVMTMFSTFTNRFPPVSLAGYALFLSSFTRALENSFGPGKIKSWFFEFGNEPDAPKYFWGSPVEYKAIFNKTAQALKNSGLSLSQTGGTGFTSSLFEKDIYGNYLKQAYVAEASVFSGGANNGLITFHRYERAFRKAQATKQEYGAYLNGTNKTKAITEWNIDSPGSGTDIVLGGGKTTNRDYFMCSLADVLEFSYDQNVNYLYVHKLMDAVNLDSSGQQIAQLGLFDVSGNPKNAYFDLLKARDVIQGGFSAYDFPNAIVIKGKQEIIVRAKGNDSTNTLPINHEGYVLKSSVPALNPNGITLYLPQGEWVIFKKDTQAPLISITSPTTGSAYSTGSNSLDLAGDASDNLGVVQVSWVNNQGGSGQAVITAAGWSMSGVSLVPADNIITVTAYDAAGNSSSAGLTVTYKPLPPIATTQTVGLLTPTSSILNAWVNPNGLAAEAWFEYGASSGSYALSTPKQALAAGTADMAVSAQLTNLTIGQTYYYRAAAQNSAGTAYGGELSFLSSFQANIQKFSQFPLRGTWGLAGGVFSDQDSDIINNSTKLNGVITQYNTYGLNAAMVRYDDLSDINFNLTAGGINFLSQMAANGIKVIINLNPGGQSFISGTWVNSLPNVKSFLLSLNQYRNQNQNGYDNILAFFLCSDVGSQRVANVKLFADYIRNSVYNNILGINRQLDVPLMIDTSGKGDATPRYSLDQYIEAIGVYNYPLLSLDDNSQILATQKSLSGLPDGRFFTFTQVHSQQWYNVLFYGNNLYNSDPLPDGVQIASELYQNIRANVNKSMLYIAPYLKTTPPTDYARDRLAEIGLFNKLIAPLVSPVLGNSSLNQNAGTVVDSAGDFSGNILNFTDANGNIGALLVIASTSSKTNYILGDSSAQNVVFDLKNSGLNLTGPALQAIEIRFPAIRALPFSVSGPGLSLTIPSIDDNAMVLMTSDQNLVSRIDQAIKAEQSNARNLLREAFLGRFGKTAKEISDMQNAGFALTSSEQSILSSLSAASNALNNMTYRQIRSAISQVGDFQLAIYKRVLNIAGAIPIYPNSNSYSSLYYSLGVPQFAANVPAYLASCDPQKFHFYLLSEYISRSCDAVQPGVSILAPANGSKISGITTLNGTASDNVAVSSVAVSIDGAAYRLATGTASWTFSLNTAALSLATHTITARAVDISGNAAVAAVTVVVSNPAPVITSASSATGTTGTALSYQITATNSPTSFSATGLPAGLSVSTGTGLVSGTPTTTGISSVIISAANGSGTDAKTMTLSVYSACDVNRDWSTNVVDVQLQVNAALGAAACASDLDRDGSGSVIDVQRGVNAGLGGPCVVGP